MDIPLEIIIVNLNSKQQVDESTLRMSEIRLKLYFIYVNARTFTLTCHGLNW